MGYSEARFEKVFADKIEGLPGNIFLEQGEIKKALEGRSFFTIGDLGEDVLFPGIEIEQYLQYHGIWEDFHYTRCLPHGGGTLHEPKWIIDVIKIGEQSWNSAMNHIRANPIFAGIDK